MKGSSGSKHMRPHGRVEVTTESNNLFKIDAVRDCALRHLKSGKVRKATLWRSQFRTETSFGHTLVIDSAIVDLTGEPSSSPFTPASAGISPWITHDIHNDAATRR